MTAKDIGKLRIVKYVNHIISLSRLVDKPITQLSRAEVERLVSKINTSDYSDHTKRDHKIIIKKYFQWSRKLDEADKEYPDEVRWIKTGQKRRRILPETLLTLDEVKRLVEAAETPRDKAFLLCDYESGCRIGEVLSLRIRNVAFDKNGAILLVDGKTGQRRIRLIAASPALASWMAIHPRRDDPDEPLWIGTGTVGRYEALNYDAARHLLKRIAEKAGLKKRVYTHLMRHSRATELAPELKESVLKELLGWVPGSNMPEVYVHLSGRDVDAALLRLNGVAQDEEVARVEHLTSIACPRCRQKVGPESQYCPSCGLVLDVKAAVRLEDERTEVDEWMNRLMGDPEFRDFLSRKLDELVAVQPRGPSS